MNSEQERAKAEQERAHAEVEERNWELRIHLAELNSARGERAQTDGEGETTGQAQAGAPPPTPPQSFSARKLLPPFEEARDDLDAYIKRFECVAQSQSWPKSKCAIAISTCLTGEALKVYGRLSPEKSLDYNQVKLALVQRFRFTA